MLKEHKPRLIQVRNAIIIKKFNAIDFLGSPKSEPHTLRNSRVSLHTSLADIPEERTEVGTIGNKRGSSGGGQPNFEETYNTILNTASEKNTDSRHSSKVSLHDLGESTSCEDSLANEVMDEIDKIENMSENECLAANLESYINYLTSQLEVITTIETEIDDLKYDMKNRSDET